MSSDPPLVHFELDLTPEGLARWHIGRDGRVTTPPAAGTRVPLSWLVFLRAQPVLGVEFRELLGRDPDRGLYGGVSLRGVRSLRVGQRLQARSFVTSRREVDSPRGRMRLTTLLTRYDCEGVEHATEEVRMVDLPPVPEGGAKPTAADNGPAHASAHPAWAQIPAITRNQVAWLTVDTGDTNALHLDAAYAASRGYPDVVVPATLLTALYERAISARVPAEIVGLDVRYVAPTHPGQDTTLHAAVQEDGLVFQAVTGGRLCAEGRCHWGPTR